MKLAGKQPTALNHNCSGKHTGMLAYARLKGYPLTDYLDPAHPVQVDIRETLGEMLGMDPGQMPLGIDGCSAPVYGVPMLNMAQAVASLAEPAGMEETKTQACRTITSAMIANPLMIAGRIYLTPVDVRLGLESCCEGRRRGCKLLALCRV